MPVKEWAIDGVHDAAWKVAESCLNQLPCARVVDIGCGPGAFIERFRGKGLFCAACDYRSDLSQADHCDRFYEVDLNDYVAGSVLRADGRFGLAVAIEIIEHVENPWQFVRMLNSVLESGGYCIVTTPNNQDEASRVDFLTHGQLPWFGLKGLEVTGHISAIFVQHFYLMVQDAGFECVDHWIHGVVPCPRMNWKGRLIRMLMRRKIMRNPGLEGLNHIWLLRKVTEWAESKGNKTAVERLNIAERLSRIAPKWL